MDIHEAFESGDLNIIRNCCRSIHDQIIKLHVEQIYDKDGEQIYDEDFNNVKIQQLRDKFSFRSILHSAIEGYRKSNYDINIMKYVIFNFDIDLEYYLEELIYNNENDDLRMIINDCIRRCNSSDLSNGLAVACEMNDLESIDMLIIFGGTNEYALQRYLNIDCDINHSKLHNIIYDLIANKPIYRLIRIIRMKHPIFYIIQQGFSNREFDVVLNHFIDRRSINKIQSLIGKLLEINYNQTKT